MGRLVGAFGTSHIANDRAGVEDQADRVYAGMREIGNQIRALEPDVLFVISSDHMTNFNLSLQAPWIIAVGDTFTPMGDMGIPKDEFMGNRQFAEGFVNFAAHKTFDLAKSEEYSPDHGVSLPVYIAGGKQNMTVVPFLINISMNPIPMVARCWELGTVLRQYIEEKRPQDEKVVVMGTGGLSHWLCMPEMGRVNEDFDRTVIKHLCAGDSDALTSMECTEILREAGNGGLEILNWIMMAGAANASSGEEIYYEAIPQWLTGMGGVRLNVA